MKTIRCFIAANVDLAVARRMADVQRDLKNAGAETDVNISWVPPQNMHVTLRFLGAITEPMVQAIKDNVSPASRRTSPLEFRVGGLGLLPEGDNPRVLYAGVHDPSGALEELYTDVSRTLEKTGFKHEERPFFPHITIGRIQQGSAEGLSTVLARHQTTEMGISGLHDILCYRSDFPTRKTDYHLLWRLPLLGNKKPESVLLNAPESAPGVSDDEKQP